MTPPLMFSRQVSAPAESPADDPVMLAEKLRNPETFAVERESEWSSSALAYLNPLKVRAMFDPWYERPPEYGPPDLTMQSSGRNIMAFYAHGDPSEVNHRFGFAVAHLEVTGGDMPPSVVAEILARLMSDPDEPPEEIKSSLPVHHVVFDMIHFWDPADFPDHMINYPVVMDWIFDNVVLAFRPRDITFDHFNVPSTVGYLQQKIRENQQRLAGQQVTVHVRNATNQLNWDTYENFKAALNQGLVHAPFHQEGHDELKYLQKPRDKKVCAPETGPVTTDDIADAISITVWKLLDANAPYSARGLAIRPHAGMLHGPDPMARMSPWSGEQLDLVRGAFSASRARARGQVSQGLARSGQPAARGLRADQMPVRGRRTPLGRWR